MAHTLGQRLAIGDQEAFAALYDRLALRLLRTAATLTGSVTEAEDVVQGLFVELARGRARLADVTDLEAYVFTMLRHAISRRSRRAAVGRRALAALADARQRAGRLVQGPPALADDGLARAVAALPAPQREVLALKFDGGRRSPRSPSSSARASTQSPVAIVTPSKSSARCCHERHA